MEELSSVHKSKILPKWLTSVTPFSKALALSMFIIFPIVGFYLGMIYQQKIDITRMSVAEVNDADDFTIKNNIEREGFYSVEYPSDFVMISKYSGDLIFTKREWEGASRFNPTVGLKTYSGDIPSTMGIREWLGKVSTGKRWDSFANTNIPCKYSKQELRAEIAGGYGGSDSKLEGDECLYFAVRNIKTINLPNVNINNLNYPDIQIIEFESSGSGGVGNEGTHVLISTGTGVVFEIFKNMTTSVTEDKRISDVYELLKSSFKLVEI